MPEPILASDLAFWRAGIQEQAERTFVLLTAQLDVLADDVRPAAATLLARRDELLKRLSDLMPSDIDSCKTRCHGDLHLGQILVADADVVISNFDRGLERPVGERRAKRTPLAEVGSIVASLMPPPEPPSRGCAETIRTGECASRSL